jgi:hypothetical protein
LLRAADARDALVAEPVVRQTPAQP